MRFFDAPLQTTFNTYLDKRGYPIQVDEQTKPNEKLSIGQPLDFS
jgi:hypothetical protein